MKLITDGSLPTRQDSYFIKIIDESDGEVSKDVAEFIPGFPWPIPPGFKVIAWVDEENDFDIVQTPPGKKNMTY